MVDERNVKDPIMKRFVAFLLLELYESMRLGTSLSEVIAILESLNFIGKKDLEIIKRGGLLKIAIGNLIDVGILRVPAEKDIDTLARFAEKSLSAESGPPASFRLFAEESER